MSVVGGKRILIVDDDPDCRLALRVLLQDWGYRVEEAPDGQAAMAIAVDRRPDVILLDLGLPGLSGYEVAKQIRSAQDGAASYLVALTGSDPDEDVATAACFDAYVLKPADPDRLKELLATRHAKDRSRD